LVGGSHDLEKLKKIDKSSVMIARLRGKTRTLNLQIGALVVSTLDAVLWLFIWFTYSYVPGPCLCKMSKVGVVATETDI
jgi:hypothetical protein